ncbi:MAG: hypothetical protein U5L11_08650 [Arhodomonas sp.]|nr:hypothetical protein [Arhodomonas sp.]
MLRRHGLGLLACALLIGAGPALQAADAVETQREAAVALARDGHLHEAIERLRVLQDLDPGNVRVLADLVVLWRQADRNDAIVALMQGIDPTVIPDYAHLDWARALRDRGRFADAARVLHESRQRLGETAEILYGVTLAEAGRPDRAYRALHAIRPLPDAPSPLAQMAYGMRRAGHPREALQLANRALLLDPDHTEAYTEEVLSLWANGGLGQALERARARGDLFTADTLYRLEADGLAAAIHDALDARRLLEDAGRFGQRNAPLASVLLRLEDFLERVPGDHAQHRRARLDHLYVLRELGRMPEAIAAYEALPGDRAIPPYARQAAADAYLDQRRPDTALALYHSVVAETEVPSVELQLALYYTHLAREKYAEAARILETLDHRTPARLPPRRAGWERAINWERLSVDQLWSLDAAYRQQHALAWNEQDPESACARRCRVVECAGPASPAGGAGRNRRSH